MSKTISHRTLLALTFAVPFSLGACSTAPAGGENMAITDNSSKQRLRANCELPSRVSKLGNTTVVDARQRVFANRADCESRGGDMLAIAD